MNDLEIYKKAAVVLETGENIALATVISTTGSSPGKVGYKMLVWGKKGETFGTVGGGSVEAEVINTAKNMLSVIERRVLRFDLNGTEDDEKAICGGVIELLVETFDRKSLPLFGELSDVIKDRGKGALVSIISSKKPPEKIFLKNIDEVNSSTNVNFSAEVIKSIKKLVAKEEAVKRTLEDGEQIFVETVCEQPMVFIFGAGHLSYYISRFAKSLNFRVTVCDDRAEFANKKRFPDADTVIVEDFAGIFDRIEVNKDSYIVIVTKGHKWDEMVLEKAVQTDAKYIGMIGSERKTLTILKRLNERGIPEEKLKKVYSPIGISIGAVTPEEIALSIAAELIKIRRDGHESKANHMTVAFSTRLDEENL